MNVDTARKLYPELVREAKSALPYGWQDDLDRAIGTVWTTVHNEIVRKTRQAVPALASRVTKAAFLQLVE